MRHEPIICACGNYSLVQNGSQSSGGSHLRHNTIIMSQWPNDLNTHLLYAIKYYSISISALINVLLSPQQTNNSLVMTHQHYPNNVFAYVWCLGVAVPRADDACWPAAMDFFSIRSFFFLVHCSVLCFYGQCLFCFHTRQPNIIIIRVQKWIQST